MKKKVLIFYISRFSGHYHAASAIEKGLQDVYGDVEVKKINALGYTNPILEKIINKAYLEVIKKKPELWGNMYDNPSVMKKTKKARETLHRFNMSKIKKLIDESSPDAIFCTQAFPCGMVADYKKSCDKEIPLVGVLTDYAPHSYWLFDEVDFYVTPSEETAVILVEKGVPPQKIRALGIPVDPKFQKTLDKTAIRRKFDLEETSPCILIMGGSQGLGSLSDVVKTFIEDKSHNYQLLVVTGSNKKLFSKLKRIIKKKAEKRVRLFSFTEDIDELMEVSDAIVTKAGGMTVAESMIKGLPLLIVNPIPGHERMNTDYLTEKGAAIEIKENDIYQNINEVFSGKETLLSMKKCIEGLVKTDSAAKVAKLAFER